MERIADRLKKICESNHVTACSEISASDIVYDASFRNICEQNGCGMYGRCYMCPPDIGTVEDLMREAKSFPQGILYQTVGMLEDSFDFEGMQEAKNEHIRITNSIEREISDLGLKRHIHMGTGGCGICEKCAKIDGIPCRYPDLAHPSISAFGIFVAQTAKNVGLKYINGENTVTYFSLILYEA